MRKKKEKAAIWLDRDVLKKIFLALKGSRLLLLLSLLLALASVASALYVPILIGRAIDFIAGKGQVRFEEIGRILLQAGVIAGATALLQWLMGALNNRMAFSVVRDLRQRALETVEHMPLRQIDARAHGEIVSRVIVDADTFADGLLLGFTQLFTGVLTIFGTLAFMLAIDWKTGLVVILLTPISLLCARFIAKRTHRLFRTLSDTRAEQTGFLDEMIQNQKIVQAFSHMAQSQETFDEINERLTGSYQQATFYSSITNPATRFVNALVYASVALIGALTALATGGIFSVGQLSVFLSYAAQYTKPFNEISGVVTELQNALACAGRLFTLIEERQEQPDARDARVLSEPQGNIELADVSFSYDAQKKLIEQLNLTVRPRQRIAIVGPTGCGKTTLINLLMRFYDVDGGAIRIEGTDIRNITRHSLRAGFGMVLQETWLRAGTIRENITLGKPDATEEEIVAAAKAARAHGFIMRLPKGYDTLIGEDASLSQGQKQLLCIARVMLRLPPMLILDEATSSIDTRTEQRVQAAFSHLMEGRTSIVVAHRLSTIREADVILVMKDGKVIERGRHEELLKQGGFYAELYQSQFTAL